MSTSKHFDKVCLGILALTLLLTVLFMNGSTLGIKAAEHTMGYENRLFDTSSVHSIAIVMNDWDTFIENCESEEYSPCTVVIDGEKYANVGIRAKGNTSLSNVKSMGSERYSFKLEFDQYDNGKSYHGLDKLCLNNLIQDNTMMKDYLVYQMMNEFDVDSPLCSYVYITVNGEDWGLYLAVEGIEDSFLERNYGNDTGNLYKPDSMSFGGGRGNGKDFNMDDFNPGDMDFSQFNPQGSSQNKEKMKKPDSESSATPSTNQMGETPQDFPERPDQSMSPPDNEKGFTPGDFPQDFDPSMSSIDSESSSTPQTSESNKKMPDNPMGNDKGGFGGMGSDDVKLKYMDDDPASYSNIFDNAKTDISEKDKETLISSLKNLSEYTNLEDTLDIEEVIRYFVIHNFVCNGDSYTGSMIHNYYLHEKNGILSMIPWDYNLAFGTFQGGQASSTINESIDDPVNGSLDDRPMLGWIFSDETYTNQYHELFEEFLTTYFSEDQLVKMIDETAAMISPYVEKDPTKFCTTEEFTTGIETMKSFVTLRAQAVTNQLQGDSTPVTVKDLDLSTMGTMNMGKGGMDKPGNRDEDTNNTSFSPGTMPTPPEGNMPQMNNEDGKKPSEFDGNIPQMDNAEGKPSNDFPTMQKTPSNPWGLLGASVVVLIVGLMTALKFKY